MLQNPLAITILAVSILYLIVIAIIFWRFRISLRHLNEKIEECHQEEKEKKIEAAHQKTYFEQRNIIYQKQTCTASIADESPYPKTADESTKKDVHKGTSSLQ